MSTPFFNINLFPFDLYWCAAPSFPISVFNFHLFSALSPTLHLNGSEQSPQREMCRNLAQHQMILGFESSSELPCSYPHLPNTLMNLSSHLSPRSCEASRMFDPGSPSNPLQSLCAPFHCFPHLWLPSHLFFSLSPYCSVFVYSLLAISAQAPGLQIWVHSFQFLPCLGAIHVSESVSVSFISGFWMLLSVCLSSIFLSALCMLLSVCSLLSLGLSLFSASVDSFISRLL